MELEEEYLQIFVVVDSGSALHAIPASMLRVFGVELVEKSTEVVVRGAGGVRVNHYGAARMMVEECLPFATADMVTKLSTRCRNFVP